LSESRDTRPPGEIDLVETRRRFLLAREQAAQASTRYRAICEMRRWSTPRSSAASPAESVEKQRCLPGM
jgi:hypothetical protein